MTGSVGVSSNLINQMENYLVLLIISRRRISIHPLIAQHLISQHIRLCSKTRLNSSQIHWGGKTPRSREFELFGLNADINKTEGVKYQIVRKNPPIKIIIGSLYLKKGKSQIFLIKYYNRGTGESVRDEFLQKFRVKKFDSFKFHRII